MNVTHGIPVVHAFDVIFYYSLFIRKFHFVAEVYSSSINNAKNLCINTTVYIVEMAGLSNIIVTLWNC